MHDFYSDPKTKPTMAMRQSGVLAAMCLYALDHNVDRLADNHALATSIAERLETLRKVETVLPIDSNIAIFDLAQDAPSAPDLVRLLQQDSVVVGAFGEWHSSFLERNDRIVTLAVIGSGKGKWRINGRLRPLQLQ